MDSHQRRSGEDLREGGGRETTLGTYSMKVIYFCERKIDKCEREIRKACFLLPTFLLSPLMRTKVEGDCPQPTGRGFTSYGDWKPSVLTGFPVSIAVFTLRGIWGFGLAA